MNATRRRKISQVIKELQTENPDYEYARKVLDMVLDEETDARDNTPESLQDTDRYYTCEEACELLEQALDDIAEEFESPKDAINTLYQIDGVV